MNFAAAPPWIRAACITFVLPDAKPNSSAAKRRIGAGVSPLAVARNRPSSLRQPSSAASLAWISAATFALAMPPRPLVPEHHFARLIGEKVRRARHQSRAVDLVSGPRGTLLVFSALAKTLRLMASATGPVGGHPPRGREPFLQVGDNFAGWGEDETDQILLGQAHPRERAAADGISRLALRLKLWLSNVLPQRLSLLKSFWWLGPLMTRRRRPWFRPPLRLRQTRPLQPLAQAQDRLR